MCLKSHISQILAFGLDVNSKPNEFEKFRELIVELRNNIDHHALIFRPLFEKVEFTSWEKFIEIIVDFLASNYFGSLLAVKLMRALPYSNKQGTLSDIWVKVGVYLAAVSNNWDSASIAKAELLTSIAKLKEMLLVIQKQL